MNKLLPILFVLLICSCSKPEIPSHRLIENGGLFYEQDSNKPFTGSSVKYVDTKLFSKTYIDDGIIIKKETFYPNGKTHTIENFIKGEGGNQVKVFDRDGKDISNEKFLTFWDNGLLKNRGNYINGKKDGVWEEFDSLGTPIIRTFWRDNKLLPITDFEKIQLRKNIPFLINSTEPYTGIIRFKETDNTGVILQEFKLGKPSGIHERRYPEEIGDLLISYFMSNQKGLSFNFEYKYLVDEISFYDKNLYGYGFYENGQKSYEFFDLDGISKNTQYYENGQVKQEGQWVFNSDETKWFRDGNFTVYHENGQIKSEMIFNEDVQGITKMFSETGLDISNGEGLGYEDKNYKPKQGYYLNGLKEGKWEDEDGGFDTYQKGKKEGPSINKLGRSNCTWKVGSYINDKKEGEWKEYENCKENDDSYVITNYKNGEIVGN